MLSAWMDERSRKGSLDELSFELGIPASELDKPEHHDAILKFVSARFSSELLRNRLSDLCGWISLGWLWLGALLQLGVLLTVIWYTVTQERSTAVMAWSIIAIALFFLIVGTMFNLLCRLLTGRYPGQARRARRSLVKHVNARGTVIDMSVA
jgi:hypothetical protein